MTDLLFTQAMAAHRAGRLADAERLYGQILAAAPKNFTAQYQLGFLLYQQGRSEAALQATERALVINPNDRSALELHSALLVNAGRLDAALASITKVTSRHPDDAAAWRTRAFILSLLKRFTEALQSVDAALARKPDFVEALTLRADALTALKRYAEAVVAFDAVLARSPNHVEAWNNRGAVLYEQERFPDSLDSYDHAVRIKPDFALAWTNRGKTLNRQERFDEALASYDKALALEPGKAEAWHARALVLRTLHRLDDALASVDKALALRTDDSQMLFTRGWLLCELGRIAEGQEVLRRTAARDLAAGVGGTKAISSQAVSPHKQNHDAAQRAYLAEQGLQLPEGGINIADGERVGGGAVNASTAAAAQWEKSRPRIVVIDNFLTAEALEKIREFCRCSTVWRVSYESGYLGAVPEQGFASPLLAQIATELRDKFPEIVGDHRLRNMWGFSYDSRLNGISLHADQAAVNVNFWITPDEANLDPESGGMIIWDVASPEDWDFRKYNTDEPAMRAFLARTGAKAVRVPYRANRAVIFDSDLFHETDAIAFKDGYLNRRINITMLYGRRTYYGK